MKKSELKLQVASLVECGKGLALASYIENAEAREATEKLLNEQIDAICEQLTLLCEDVDLSFIGEMLENGERKEN